MSDKPSKERVRKWLDDQVKSRKPLPDRKQIRRELGWEMVSPKARKRPKR